MLSKVISNLPKVAISDNLQFAQEHKVTDELQPAHYADGLYLGLFLTTQAYCMKH